MGRVRPPGPPGPRPPRPPRPPLAMPLLLLPPLVATLAARGVCAAPAPAPRAEDLSLGVEWLRKFGYLPPADPEATRPPTPELSSAISSMQRFGGLEPTGLLDEATLVLMRTPRCSLPDVPASTPTRRRRQAPAPVRWNKRILSWRVRTFPRDSQLGRDTVRALMYYALKVWSDIAPLDFHEVAGNMADIQVDFSRAAHDDRFPFDGPGGTLAHAFLPGDNGAAGDTHFDDDEIWTFRSSDAHGMDLFAVAVHEFGHAIGLSHVAAMNSVMQPYYQGPVGDPLRFRLPYEDRVRVWQLYGMRESVSLTAQPDVPDPSLLPEPPNNRSSTLPHWDAPPRCNAHFDAVAQIRGEAFFFKGRYFWRLTRDGHLVSLQPAHLHRFWRGLPLHLDSVDAVYERLLDHKIVFFKGGRYWVFKDNNAEEGFPRPVSDFGLPADGIDAALSRPPGDKTYFFKDQLYWCFDEHTRRLDPGHPAPSPPWTGLPSTLDAAMHWSDGASYFFHGSDYWKVLDGEEEVAPGFPQLTARDWLVCEELPAQPEGTDQAPAPPGRQGRSHAEDGFEVCSCTSRGSQGPLLASALLLMLPLLLLLLPMSGTITQALAPSSLPPRGQDVTVTPEIGTRGLQVSTET